MGVSKSSKSIKVLAFSEYNYNKRIITFYEDNNNNRYRKCINLQDSIYLNQAYQRVIFSEDNVDIFTRNLNEFKSRLKKIKPRYKGIKFRQ